MNAREEDIIRRAARAAWTDGNLDRKIETTSTFSSPINQLQLQMLRWLLALGLTEDEIRALRAFKDLPEPLFRLMIIHARHS
jgi:hypothetical protein